MNDTGQKESGKRGESIHSLPDGLLVVDAYDLPQAAACYAPLQGKEPVDTRASQRLTVQLLETHISWIFLIGNYAYKVKKPIKNDFLDYSRLELRKRYCELELELDSRYAPELYLGVVPIADTAQGLRVNASGEIVDYAVKMRRFPSDALLRNSLAQDKVSVDSLCGLARRLAEFHQKASASRPQESLGSAEFVIEDALDNFAGIENALKAGSQFSFSALPEIENDLASLLKWTQSEASSLSACFARRLDQGKVRECHGDLHTNNVVHWHGEWMPFDGIEFCDRFRWIDVFSDVAFLIMDLMAQEYVQHAWVFRNAYLEATGDRSDLQALRWYTVYRAMVRAKVDAIRWRQCEHDSAQQDSASKELVRFVRLARKLIEPKVPTLWITHGFSGSGKSTGAMDVVRREGAIVLRSDVERKRLLHVSPTYRPEDSELSKFYAKEHTERTYDKLAEDCEKILQAGESVVVDATFLEHRQRSRMQEIAVATKAKFRILDFRATPEELRSRIRLRRRAGDDASDASLEVLDHQLANADPLKQDEMPFVTTDQSEASC